MNSGRPHLSVVIASGCESGNLTSLVGEIIRLLRPRMRFEIVIVDDACGPGVAEELAWIAVAYRQVLPLTHSSRRGQSAALCSGVQAATAPVVVVMDGSGRHDPAALPALYARLDLCQSLSMVEGAPVVPDASAVMRVMLLVSRWLHRHLPDNEWLARQRGPLMFYRSAFLHLPVHDDMYRRLPALLRDHGYDTGTVPVPAPLRRQADSTGDARSAADLVGPPGHIR